MKILWHLSFTHIDSDAELHSQLKTKKNAENDRKMVFKPNN